MLYECADGDCLGSVMSSLLLTLITSCVMRLHMCSANSQITILISGSRLLEFFAPVLPCLAAIWEQTSLNCLPLIPVLVPGACQRPVLVILQGLWLGIRNLV